MRGASWRQWLVVWLVPFVIVGGLVAGMVASRPVGPPGGGGAGDPYLPDAGASGWDAESYTIRVELDADARELRGTTTIRGRATTHLTAIHFDLWHAPTSARVNGVRADVAALGGVNRAVRPAAPLAPGARFTVEVVHEGDPATTPIPYRERPVHRTEGEILIAGEPQAAAAWFASNDHPSDAARVEVLATVPAGREALSVGRLVSRDADDDPTTDTWHWRSDEEMATYLTFLAVGDFAVEVSEVAGRQVVHGVSTKLPDATAAAAWAQLRRTPEVVAQLEALYGPYPFSSLGGVVVATEPWFSGLETQGRPVYDRSLAGAAEVGAGWWGGPGWADNLLAHELAHQWFGNHVRVATWDDIVNNEGWATFVAQDWQARHADGQPMDAWLRSTWEGTPPELWEPSVADPGIENLFGTTYLRGGMAVQALRTVLGDEAFFDVARGWAQDGGARSFEDYTAFVDARTGRDLGAFWDAWYRRPVAPPRTAAFGWPS